MERMTLGHVAERNARKWPDEEAVVGRDPEAGLVATRAFEEVNDRADRWRPSCSSGESNGGRRRVLRELHVGGLVPFISDVHNGGGRVVVDGCAPSTPSRSARSWSYSAARSTSRSGRRRGWRYGS